MLDQKTQALKAFQTFQALEIPSRNGQPNLQTFFWLGKKPGKDMRKFSKGKKECRTLWDKEQLCFGWTDVL